MPTFPNTALLRVSPAYALCLSNDGQPYVAKDSEPYEQFWLTDEEHSLHFILSRVQRMTAHEAVTEYCRLTGAMVTESLTTQLLATLDEMRRVGVIVEEGQDLSRYTAAIVDDYLAHRPFPQEIAAHIVRQAPVLRNSRVLDLAGGPGDLALALASVADDVSLMDLSAGFLGAAAQRAADAGVSLTTVHESCNRLVLRDDLFDVITLAQALPWLDDVLLCRGIQRVLNLGGSFFVVHASIDVDEAHPLALVLGRQSVFGAKAAMPFAEEVDAVRVRLARLFHALGTPGIHQVLTHGAHTPASSPIVPTHVALFAQQRPFGLGFVNGFLTDAHITSTGREPLAFRRELAGRVGQALPASLVGTMHWAVLQFTRGGTASHAGAASHVSTTIPFLPGARALART